MNCDLVLEPIFQSKTAIPFYNLAHVLCTNYQSIQSFCAEIP
jgi:hypothetical protein